jgi:hypothetical protein
MCDELERGVIPVARWRRWGWVSQAEFPEKSMLNRSLATMLARGVGQAIAQCSHWEESPGSGGKGAR